MGWVRGESKPLLATDWTGESRPFDCRANCSDVADDLERADTAQEMGMKEVAEEIRDEVDLRVLRCAGTVACVNGLECGLKYGNFAEPRPLSLPVDTKTE
jgi:hypothetical protein